MAIQASHTKGSTKVVTGKVRLSYVHLFEKFTNIEDAEPKYSVVLLVDKKDKSTIAAIRDAQKVALEAGKSSKFNGSIPKAWKDTFRDGDEEGDLEKNPEYEGMMFMTVSSDRQPGIVDKDVSPILDSTEVYSGCFARVSINAFPFNRAGNKGVSFGLQHVQKLADGDPLGNITRAEDDFESIEDEDEDDLLG